MEGDVHQEEGRITVRKAGILTQFSPYPVQMTGSASDRLLESQTDY